MSDDRTIALRSQTPPDVAELASLIKAMLPNGQKLSDQEALAGAMYGKVHNLSPFKGEYYIIPGKGIFPGYRGEMRMNEQREYYTQTRPLRNDEAAEHEILPGDTARIVELYQPDLMAKMRTMGVQYQPITGVGIVRKSEKYKSEDWVGEYPNKRKVKLDPPLPIDPPTGRSWAWKAEQRALKDAMRHMQGGADILDETVSMQLEAAEQHADAVTAEVRNLPEAEQQVQFQARVTAMRGDPEHNPFDDSAPTPAAPKLAIIKCKDYFDLALTFSAVHPAWQNKDGNADNGHICASIAKLGFAEITAGNVVEVFNKLEAYALSKEADEAAGK